MTKYELPFKIVHGFDYPEDMPEKEIRKSVSNRLASLKAKGFGGIVTVEVIHDNGAAVAAVLGVFQRIAALGGIGNQLLDRRFVSQCLGRSEGVREIELHKAAAARRAEQQRAERGSDYSGFQA